MNKATPGFYNLFRRSRYFRPARPLDTDDEEDSEELKKERREVERFVVACIGFCLQHDKAFRDLFWTQVLGGRPRTRFPKGAHIEVEPEDWADLRIQWQCRGEHHVHVVECKVGAKLNDKQNPRTPKFARSGGYGRFLREYGRGVKSDAQLAYTLLGVRTKLELPPTHKALPISLRQILWTALALPKAVSRLHNDLINSLSNLAIPEFRMIKAKFIIIKSGPGLSALYNADTVINAVIENLALVRKCCETIAEGDDSGICHYGAYIKEIKGKKVDASFHKNLWKRLNEMQKTKKHWAAFWFGYSGDKISLNKQVTFYTGYLQPDEKGKEKATTIMKHLRKVCPGASTKIDWDNDVWVVTVVGKVSKHVSDLEWFTKVIHGVCGT